MNNGQALVDAFGLRAGDLVALVGGGGKSSLMFALEQCFLGRVVLTTTTRLWAAQTGRARAHLPEDQLERLGEVLTRSGSCLVTGRRQGDKVTGVAQGAPHSWLARPDVDLVVVEADGSRGRPVKAPADHEPVLPLGVTRVVVMAGLDALDGPIEAVAHRPARVSALTGLEGHNRLAPADLAFLLTHREGGLKGVPPGARVVFCLNKLDLPGGRRRARETAAAIGRYVPGARVVLAALQSRRPVWAVVC